VEKITIDKKEIDEVYDLGSGADADIVALGCPHCSITELKRIAEMLSGKKVRKDLWVCTARKIAETCPHLVKKIEESGAKVICDTCMVVSPATQRYKKMMTNSGKALVYLPGLCNVEAGLGSTEECIQCATEA
jgi:predicted aconitase